ncbi:outer membrane protein assembly factor BamD [Gangjinia marincola]|uniref:Outer membrane protein assembly factor BamD n=1 Tax=Gangjinia marincola TaxID=578463 RepID=A0ABP3XTY5_9FLAO
MKKIISIFIILISLTGCGEYQRALNGDDVGKKYEAAVALYEEAQEKGRSNKGKYRKALRLLEQVVPQYRGKPQGEKLSFIYANTYFELGDFSLSGYEFDRFSTSYPRSERAEEAAYKSAKSYYYDSPRYTLDQTSTNQAIQKLQTYINRYPSGEYLDEANELAKELREKLEEKAFEIAKLYYNQGDLFISGYSNYQAAVSAFDNFIVDYPGTPYREKAYYYKFDAQYKYAIGSYELLMADRLKEAKEYFKTLKKYYPEGELTADAEESMTDINERLQQLEK